MTPILPHALLLLSFLADTSVLGQQVETNQLNHLAAPPGAISITNTVASRLSDRTQRLLETNRWVDEFLPLFLGGLLAALSGVFVARCAHRWERKWERKRDAMFQEHLLHAIRSELESVRGIYTSSMKQAIASLQVGDALEVRFAISGEWFPVFAANVAQIAKLDDTKIASVVITTYALSRKLIDELRINNFYLEQLDATARDQSERRQQLKDQLQKHASKIKAADEELERTTAHLLSLLTHYG